MASPDVLQHLAEIPNIQGDKAGRFANILNTILTTSSAGISADLDAFVDAATSISDSDIVTARSVLNELPVSIRTIPSAEIKKSVFNHILEKLRPKIVAFEQLDCTIREALAHEYESTEEYGEAAKVLQGIQLSSQQRQISDEYRLNIYIRIMRNFLEEEEFTSADSILARAMHIIHKTEDLNINLQFQMCQAKILDSKRNFLNACSKYHQLSFSPLVDEDDRLQCLSAAMTCAILAPAGPLRSRSLATLYKDDRSPQLQKDYSLLEKMYLDRLLTPEEVDEFASRLRSHQKATLADGTTVLSKAVIEHNLVGASKLYNNIGVAELGVLLNLSAEKAEEYAARMIEQKRLGGQIDQIDGLIYFDSTTTAGGASAERIVGRQLRRWDENVGAVAQEVENITSLLQNEYPVFVSTKLAVS